MKSLKNIGKILNRAEQKEINGGGRGSCINDGDCGRGLICECGDCIDKNLQTFPCGF